MELELFVAPLRRGGRNTLLVAFLLIATVLFIAPVSSSPESYDLVILNGRVIDPEARTDAIRNLGISNGTLKTISTRNLTGRTVIDARGLVVSPGFIDLHQHGQDEENYRFKAMDGVTTALEGRIRIGADADLTIFDARSIADKSSFHDPAQYAEGIRFVVVNGVLIVKDGELQPNVNPGRPVRAPF